MGIISTGTRFYVSFIIPQADLLAGVPFELIAPTDGFFEELQVVVQAAVTTGGTLTPRIGVVPVAGLVVTVANGAAKGVVLQDVPDEPSATRRFKKGDRINIIPAGFATAGAVNGSITFRDSATLSA